MSLHHGKVSAAKLRIFEAVFTFASWRKFKVNIFVRNNVLLEAKRWHIKPMNHIFTVKRQPHPMIDGQVQF